MLIVGYNNDAGLDAVVDDDALPLIEATAPPHNRASTILSCGRDACAALVVGAMFTASIPARTSTSIRWAGSDLHWKTLA